MGHITMDAAAWAVICSSLVAAIGGFVTALLTYLREGRAHKWQVEQAEIDRLERLTTAADLKEHTAITSATIVGKIDENTEVNKAAIAAGEKAYAEANNLSQKIYSIGSQEKS